MIYIHEFEEGWALIHEVTGEKIIGGLPTREAAEKSLADYQITQGGAQ